MKKFRVNGLVYLIRGNQGQGVLARMTLDSHVLRIKCGLEELVIPVDKILSVDSTNKPGGGRVVRIRYQSDERFRVSRLVIAGPPQPLERAYRVIKEAIKKANSDLPLDEKAQIDQEDVKLLYLLFVKRGQFSPSLLTFLLSLDRRLLEEKIRKLRERGLIDEELRVSRRGLELLRVRNML